MVCFYATEAFNFFVGSLYRLKIQKFDERKE